jgi:glycosyltransferase involved in cell wall biosynthesis
VITRLIRGGADENTVFTVEGMDPDWYEGSILAGRGSEPEGFSPKIQACTMLMPELVRDPHPFHDLVALWKMVRLMKRGRYHIVHTHTAKAGFLGRIAARIAGVPHVVHTLHGVTFHDHIHPIVRRIYVLLEKVAAPCCDVMISVGEDVKRKYLEESIGRSEQYVTIPSGMDTAPFREAREHPETGRGPLRAEFGFDDEDVVVGMVSRLEARKGYRFLFAAVQRLAPDFPHLRVLVVGEGEQREELELLARDLGIEARVRFAGFRSDVASAIAAFDVATLTSLWEGLPRVLVQYALLERPIVTFEVEGSREIVDDGRSGYVVPLRDVELLVDRLRRLVANAELRLEFGRRVRERVEGRWDVDIMVRKITEVYQDVGAGSAR